MADDGRSAVIAPVRDGEGRGWDGRALWALESPARAASRSSEPRRNARGTPFHKRAAERRSSHSSTRGCVHGSSAENEASGIQKHTSRGTSTWPKAVVAKVGACNKIAKHVSAFVTTYTHSACLHTAPETSVEGALWSEATGLTAVRYVLSDRS